MSNKKVAELYLYTDITVMLMVILPQSYGWGRVQVTGNTMWSYPAADGSVPLADEHLRERDNGPGSDVDCSELHQCHLNKHNGNAVWNSIYKKKQKKNKNIF